MIRTKRSPSDGCSAFPLSGGRRVHGSTEAREIYWAYCSNRKYMEDIFFKPGGRIPHLYKDSPVLLSCPSRNPSCRSLLGRGYLERRKAAALSGFGSRVYAAAAGNETIVWVNDLGRGVPAGGVQVTCPSTNCAITMTGFGPLSGLVKITIFTIFYFCGRAKRWLLLVPITTGPRKGCKD